MKIKDRKIMVMDILLRSVSVTSLAIMITDHKKSSMKEAIKGMAESIAIVMSNMDKFICSDEIEILLESRNISVTKILEVVAMYETDGKAKQKLQKLNSDKTNVDDLEVPDEIKKVLKDIAEIIEKELKDEN